ncbi:MAG TPA: hypothetical protein VFJ58_06225, partial [Armatimonadota bacterium]|nr:hypothetical protein [Armatimonadota bacterium]
MAVVESHETRERGAPDQSSATRASVVTIGAFDGSGFTGVPLDLRVAQAMDVHAASVTTAVLWTT